MTIGKTILGSWEAFFVLATLSHDLHIEKVEHDNPEIILSINVIHVPEEMVY